MYSFVNTLYELFATEFTDEVLKMTMPNMLPEMITK